MKKNSTLNDYVKFCEESGIDKPGTGKALSIYKESLRDKKANAEA